MFGLSEFLMSGLSKAAGRTFLLAGACLLGFVAVAPAQTIATRSVSVDAVPGLLAHMKSVAGETGYTLAKSWVKLVDMDGDGELDVIWAPGDFETECGNSGCFFNVSLKADDGTLTNVFNRLAFEFKPTNTASNGLRGLEVTTRDGLFNMMWDGKTYIGADQYIMSNGAYEAAGPDWRVTTAQQTIGASRARSSTPTQFLGQCYEGYNWGGAGSGDGSSGDGGGVASYGGCGDGESWVQILCTSASDEMIVRIEDEIAGARDGGAVTIPFQVGNRRFRLKGSAEYNDMVGGVTPTVKFNRNDGFLEALISGNRLSFRLGSKRSTIHLRGSSASIDAMLSHCGGS